MKNRFKVCLVVIPVLLSFLFVWGDNTKAIIEAVEGQMHIYYNGNMVQLDKKPLVVDGTTYLPLRVIAGLFNKAIEWNPATQSIDMGDKADPLVAVLKEELTVKEQKIKELEEKIKQQAEKPAAPIADMDMLEEKINKEFDTYEGIAFLILLSGEGGMMFYHTIQDEEQQ